MNIIFLDLKAQYDSIKSEIDRAVSDVISECCFILGPAVKQFEDNFARYCKCREAIAVNSGTSALYLILQGLGIGHGDEVITAANTFIATVAAIKQTGATPVLIDVDPETRNIDPVLIEKAITSKTKAVIPVHLYGQMADMEKICDIAKRNNIPVIEDAAQAHGAKYKDKPAGSFGVAAGFSFYPGKNLGAYGEGGAVVTSDKSLAGKIRKLRDHGFSRKYYCDILGYNARMDGIQGAVLNVKLKHLDHWNNRRNHVAKRYHDNLRDLAIGLPGDLKDYYNVYHQFVIEIKQREKLQDFLNENGIQTLIHYPIPVHQQQGYINAGLKPGRFPVTEKLSQTILSLPIYPELKDEGIDFVSLKIREFLEK